MPKSEPDPTLESVAQDLKTHLESLKALGINFCIKGSSTADMAEAGVPGLSELNLSALEASVRDCQKCGELVKCRTQTVFGAGHPAARLVFVGEAPGFDEDKQGKPFVGKAGQLLTKMIEAMKLKREDVYICNVLKCRPPENRNPLPDEVANCEPFLIRQLELLKPKVIVALGKFAAQTLLGTERPISQLRGKFAEYRGIPLMPTYHPAYLLRNEGDKKLVWQDLKQVMTSLGL